MKVYLVADSMSNSIKIGISKDPAKRLKQLQTGHPHRLKLLHTLCEEKYTAKQAEALLHKRFWGYRTKSSGEWFNLPDELVSELMCKKTTYEVYHS
jgi:predicted GIY-YIG superfamily endonuclease